MSAYLSAPVSVIMPLYNQACFVEEALKSVLSQTWQDFEVIVVDDGSTDNSAAVAKSLADARVTVVCQPNRGVSAARNCGIELAKGEHVAFIDSDDRWRPGFLARNLRLLHSSAGLSTVYTNVIDEQADRPRLGPGVCAEGIVADYFRTVLHCHKHLGTPSAVVTTRRALREAGGFPVGVKYSEDHDLWMRLAWVGEVGFIAEALSVYRRNPCGAMARRRKEGMPYPHLVHTYRRWKAEGRIPRHLSRSSAEFVNWTLLGYVCNLAYGGDVRRAREILLKECWPSWRARRTYAAALLLCTMYPLGRHLWGRHINAPAVPKEAT